MRQDMIMPCIEGGREPLPNFLPMYDEHSSIPFPHTRPLLRSRRCLAVRYSRLDNKGYGYCIMRRASTIVAKLVCSTIPLPFYFSSVMFVFSAPSFLLFLLFLVGWACFPCGVRLGCIRFRPSTCILPQPTTLFPTIFLYCFAFSPFLTLVRNRVVRFSISALSVEWKYTRHLKKAPLVADVGRARGRRLLGCLLYFILLFLCVIWRRSGGIAFLLAV